MTKRLEEIFNLPAVDTDDENTIEESEAHVPDVNRLNEVMDHIDKIDQALPIVRNLETNENEMDELADKAMDTFEQIMDLGMNVEAKYSGRLFEVASQMMGHAITAKDAKMTNKLKILEMQLKKARLDQQQAKEETPEKQAEGQVLNRNDLMAYILEQQKQNESKN